MHYVNVLKFWTYIFILLRMFLSTCLSFTLCVAYCCCKLLNLPMVGSVKSYLIFHHVVWVCIKCRFTFIREKRKPNPILQSWDSILSLFCFFSTMLPTTTLSSNGALSSRDAACHTAGAKRYKYLRRLLHFRQMDFEFALWQMLYLFTSPQRVYRNFHYRKQTKDQWARDDPAFLVLLSIWLCGK